MAFFLWIALPVAYGLLGKAVGWATMASCFFSERGKRLGRRIGTFCLYVLPLAYLALLAAGAEGNAGSGFELFGSATLMEIILSVPFYAAPILTAYAGVLYVVRDLTIGHGAKS